MVEQTRRIPIDFHAIAESTGLRRGKVARSPIFGWVVANVHDDPGPNFTCIEPPGMHDGETRLWIEGDYWCFA